MIRELFEKQRPLMMAGLISLALAALTLILIVADDTQILGINRWIKPLKFFSSIAIFLWTMAVYFTFLPGRETLFKFLSWAMILIFAIEMIVIVGQPLRGETSHFNNSTPLNETLFTIMGFAILALMLILVFITYFAFRSRIALPTAVAWGMRLGLIVLLLGSFQGGYMASHLSHAVGVADGGAGLPIVNWSTEGGDLRVAHFMGLHGLQAIPLAALAFERLKLDHPLALTAGFAAAYTAAFSLVFLQALMGRPLFSI